jgi:hypothetical protein
MYAAKRLQASEKSREKGRMHLSFQASQIDASRAGDSFIQMHPNIRSFTKMHLKRRKATSQIKSAESSPQAC